MAWRRGGAGATPAAGNGGRVVREYVGTGPLAELIAELDAAERARRRAGAERPGAERARLAPLEAATDALDGLAEALARAAPAAHGYRRHKRGAWRRRRGAQGGG